MIFTAVNLFKVICCPGSHPSLPLAPDAVRMWSLVVPENAQIPGSRSPWLQQLPPVAVMCRTFDHPLTTPLN
eukprot:CAMPEP_0185254912 /NCGR_PEP_ID=MMETSP1359-20130426/3879_1 /TAXON_ID=552665 /ORGANISM="Bigelowiella longifila, Strain CCMP242" /LENGTH=71 /DNA_ID=CAMNT_0027838417 /DNA_START=215 /DNA_END=427 /DNA_ORIENTATION=-